MIHMGLKHLGIEWLSNGDAPKPPETILKDVNGNAILDVNGQTIYTS